MTGGEGDAVRNGGNRRTSGDKSPSESPPDRSSSRRQAPSLDAFFLSGLPHSGEWARALIVPSDLKTYAALYEVFKERIRNDARFGKIKCNVIVDAATGSRPYSLLVARSPGATLEPDQLKQLVGFLGPDPLCMVVGQGWLIPHEHFVADALAPGDSTVAALGTVQKGEADEVIHHIASDHALSGITKAAPSPGAKASDVSGIHEWPSVGRVMQATVPALRIEGSLLEARRKSLDEVQAVKFRTAPSAISSTPMLADELISGKIAAPLGLDPKNIRAVAPEVARLVSRFADLANDVIPIIGIHDVCDNLNVETLRGVYTDQFEESAAFHAACLTSALLDPS